MKLLPLFLLLLLTGCIGTGNDAKTAISKTFYRVEHGEGDRLLVDTAKVEFRIVKGKYLIDYRNKQHTRVYKISELLIRESQIWIEMEKVSNYQRYLERKPKWKTITSIFGGHLRLDRHLDLPMYYYEYANSDKRYFVIDSLEVPSSKFGYYVYPREDQGKNDPEYYDDYDSYVAGGRKKEKVIFRLSDYDSYQKVTADQIYDDIGYRITNSAYKKEPHVRLPISPKRREFDLFVTQHISDYGPQYILHVVQDGKPVKEMIYGLMDWGPFENGYSTHGYIVQETVEVYDDYSFKEIARVDSIGYSLVEAKTYYLDLYGRFQDSRDQSMREMDWRDMPDGPEVKTVLDFLEWYRQNNKNVESLSLLQGGDNGKPYSVNTEACQSFINLLASSAFVSQSYLARWNIDFRSMEQYYKENRITEIDEQVGFDEQFFNIDEVATIMKVIPQDVIVTRVFRKEDDYAEVTVDLWTTRITYALIKEGEHWLIDKQM